MNNGKGDCGCGGMKSSQPPRVAEIQARAENKRHVKRSDQLTYERLRHVRIQGVGRIIG